MANLLRRDEFPLSPRRLRHDLDRLVDAVFSGALGPVLSPGEFVPSIELTESEKEYTVTAELPGMTEKEVQIEIDENRNLTIRGEKKTEAVESRHGYEFSERSYGQFLRTLQLPPNADTNSIEASMHDGVLELHIPKAAQTGSRAIPVGKAEAKPAAEAAPTESGAKATERPQQPPAQR